MSISNTKNLINVKMLFLIISIASTSLLSGCMKSNAATKVSYRSDIEVTDAMLKLVNSTFRTTILGGNWRYQGAQAVNGTINAYIQIPEKLEMSKEHQVNYLKMSLCPASNKHAMWSQLQGVPLSVHVYTMNKQHTIFANCANPTV